MPFQLRASQEASGGVDGRPKRALRSAPEVSPAARRWGPLCLHLCAVLPHRPGRRTGLTSALALPASCVFFPPVSSLAGCSTAPVVSVPLSGGLTVVVSSFLCPALSRLSCLLACALRRPLGIASVRVSAAVPKHHDQKQVEYGRVCFT